jgi:glycopeptide antibiotics resistance protein
LIAYVLEIVGVSVLIALPITITICILAFKSQQVPDILSNAPSAILGFYFATSDYESSKKSKE